MTDASLNDIYRLVGELGGTVRGLDSKVDDIKREAAASEEKSAAYRQGVREELGNLVLRTTHLETELHSVKTKVDAQQAITDEVKTVRDRVLFAGSLGKVLWSIGKALIAAAAGAAGAWYALTGRPPP